MKITIRKVEVGDEEILAYIQTESWKKAFHHILSPEILDKYTDMDKAKEMYTSLLKNNVGNGYLLLVEDTPHCIAYWDKARDEELSGIAELICIHSLQDNWGKGYGSIMMDYVINDMKKAGFEKVILWVFKENKRACNFYEKHKFKITKKSKKFHDAIEVMYCRDLRL